MEIQWVMLAKEIRTNPDTTMCIDGIFHRIHSDVVPLASMLLIAKLNPSPSDIGQAKILDLTVYHNGNQIGWRQFRYKVHDEDMWESRYPYATLPLRNVHLRQGKYTFRLSIENESTNEESIIVV